VVGSALALGAAISTWQAIRAVRAERVAGRERVRTEQNLGLALQALDEFVLQLAEDRHQRDSSLEAKDRSLLEKALGFYHEFATTNDDNRPLRRERARALRRAGSLQRRLDRDTEAEQALRQAICLQEELLAEDPVSDRLRL
jgi:hypothetical protein